MMENPNVTLKFVDPKADIGGMVNGIGETWQHFKEGIETATAHWETHGNLKVQVIVHVSIKDSTTQKPDHPGQTRIE